MDKMCIKKCHLLDVIAVLVKNKKGIFPTNL